MVAVNQKEDSVKKVQVLLKVCAVMASIACAVSCSKKPGGDGAEDSVKMKGKIGVTCMDLTNPFYKQISNVMEEEAAKHGYEIVSLDGNNDPAKQNSQLSDFAAQGFDAVFLNPVDSKAAGEGVKKAHAAGIPVFTFDVQVTDETAKDLVASHIGSDNYQGGSLAGESMMKVTGDQGRIALITYPEVTSCILRVDGFKDYLKENGSKLQNGHIMYHIITDDVTGQAGLDRSQSGGCSGRARTALGLGSCCSVLMAGTATGTDCRVRSSGYCRWPWRVRV